jgi:hypothetical protein
VLRTAHEGDRVTKITKREMIKGELGWFILNKGEDPQAIYNWLKTMLGVGTRVQKLVFGYPRCLFLM